MEYNKIKNIINKRKKITYNLKLTKVITLIDLFIRLVYNKKRM